MSRADPGAVSTAWSAQALAALNELLRGLQFSNEATGERLLDAAARTDPERLYAELVGALLRLVFVLFAEGRGMLPSDPKDPRSRSLAELFERLRAEAERHPEAMEQRFDAWPMLEARAQGALRQSGAPMKLPRISDGALYRALHKLMRVDGERISYQTLDVERIGSVYEGVMGFTLARATEVSIGVGPRQVVVGLASLLGAKPEDRAGRLKAESSVALTAKAAEALRRARSVDEVVTALGRRVSPLTPRPIPAGGFYLQPGEARRRSGSHYTPRALTAPVVTRTLAPLLDALGPAPTPDAVLSLRVCDPAMGSGAFLVETCRQLGEALLRAWERHGRPRDLGPDDDPLPHARRLVAQRCLYGVDCDPFAVDLARLSLWLVTRARDHALSFVDHALREGDSLMGQAREQVASSVDDGLARAPQREGSRPVRGFHWEEEFPEVFSGDTADAREGAEVTPRGFHAVVGNPPWVSYAGRAAQPLHPSRRAWYEREYRSFAGYKNLQGMFLERLTSLTRDGARWGIVLPSSMAELSGYAPTREALSRAFIPDTALPALEPDAFHGVNQPSMVLHGTTRLPPIARGSADPWPLHHADLDAPTRALLARLQGDPLPPGTFGERGLQTQGDDVAHLRAAPGGPHTVPVREGKNISAFHLGPPALWADPSRFGPRLRAPAQWQRVDVVIRQTARVPIAARSDGGAFRNTLLAGFATEVLSAEALLAWLNCTAVRWRHFFTQRDARLGMPQVKIGHLRAIPAPPEALRATLHAVGLSLGARNTGVTPDEQRDLDDRVFDALGLGSTERERIARDARRWTPRPTDPDAPSR